MILKPLGIYAPNTKFKKTSSYILNIYNKVVLLDSGIGTGKDFVKYIVDNKIALEDIMVVISHNHIDHVAGLITIGNYLLNYFPNKKIKIFMSNTSGNHYNWYKNFIFKFKSVFDITVLNENVEIKIQDVCISFCKTNHCEEKISSFATKISDGNNAFVYTSDIASVNNSLKKFVSKANVVMVDAGNPVKRVVSLNGYHGFTNSNVSELQKQEVENIFLTHLKGCFEKEIYFKNIDFVERKNINVMDFNSFNIFTGKIISSKYERRFEPSLA